MANGSAEEEGTGTPVKTSTASPPPPDMLPNMLSKSSAVTMLDGCCGVGAGAAGAGFVGSALVDDMTDIGLRTESISLVGGRKAGSLFSSAQWPASICHNSLTGFHEGRANRVITHGSL